MQMKRFVVIGCVLAAAAAVAEVPFRLGMAGYTFHKKTLDETLAIMQKADVRYLCVKDFHLRYDSDDAAIAAFKERCAKYGVVPYGLGPLYTKDAAQLRPYFEFARRMGVKVVVGVPYEPTDEKDTWNRRKGSRRQLEEVDRLVREFDIRYAIHNHGPKSPEMYPNVAYGWELVKDLDPRVGFCLDVGWEFACGDDPAETIRRHGDRIHDVHIKNFEIGQPDGCATPLPRGKIDYVKVFTALAEAGYAGVCSLEYERDFTDNLAPIAESIGYARGVTDAIRVRAKPMPVPAGANTLTEQEKAEGYELLFDGKTLPTDKWVGAKAEWGLRVFPERGWYVKDGCLTMRPVNGIANGKWFPLPPEDARQGGGGDIVTKKLYRDFAFKFDFRLTEAANSGVKYFFNPGVNRGSCEEYQVLEPEHPDATKGRDGNRRVAALYDIFPAQGADGLVRPAGQWNSGMIVAKGRRVEHWLNGVKVLEYERGSKAFRDGVAASKYLAWQDEGRFWGEDETGRLLIQDHSDSTVSYCNLKVKEL